jgi:hypothetical protein
MSYLHRGCRSRRSELDPDPGCGHAGRRSGGSSPAIDGGALQVSDGGQGRWALPRRLVQLIKRTTLVLSI